MGTWGKSISHYKTSSESPTLDPNIMPQHHSKKQHTLKEVSFLKQGDKYGDKCMAGHVALLRVKKDRQPTRSMGNRARLMAEPISSSSVCTFVTVPAKLGFLYGSLPLHYVCLYTVINLLKRHKSLSYSLPPQYCSQVWHHGEMLEQWTREKTFFLSLERNSWEPVAWRIQEGLSFWKLGCF